MVNNKMKLNTLAKLEITTANLHENINNFEKQREFYRLRDVMRTIETSQTKDTALRSNVKWQEVVDRCSTELFQSVRPRNIQAVILKLKDGYGRCFTKMKDLELIMKDCYADPYAYKDITKEALTKVIDEVSATVTNAMNETLGKEIMKNELH
jgi:hypothetical protein